MVVTLCGQCGEPIERCECTQPPVLSRGVPSKLRDVVTEHYDTRLLTPDEQHRLMIDGLRALLTVLARLNHG